jgi:hypothetical protein
MSSLLWLLFPVSCFAFYLGSATAEVGVRSPTEESRLEPRPLSRQEQRWLADFLVQGRGK